MTNAPFCFNRVRMAVIAAIVLAVAGCSSPEEKAAAYVESGMAQLKEGEYNKAGIEFRNALRLNEDLAEAWFGLSLVEESRQNWQNMNAALVRVVELQPDHLKANLGLGRIMLLAGQFDKALNYSKVASRIAPEDTAVMALRAAILYRMDDHPGATAAAEKVLEANPGSADALAILAAVRFSAGDIDAALGLLDRGLEKNERNVGLQVFKLRILDSLNDYAQVEKVLLQLVDLFPDEPAFRRELVRFLIANDRADEAESQLRHVAETDPDNAEAALDVVRLLNQIQGFEAARAELERLIAGNSKNLRFRRFLSQLEVSNGELDSAVARLQEITDNDSFELLDRNLARVDLARIELSRGNADRARNLVSQAIESDANNVGALLIQATLKLNDGEFDSAISDLRQALAEDPQSADIQVVLARAHALNGSLELADERYRTALQNSNYGPSVALAYAEYLQKQGNRQRAEEVVAEAVDRAPRNAALLGRLAEFRLAREDWLGAEEIARNLRSIEQNSIVSDRIDAAVEAGQGRLDDSVSILKSVYERSPGQTGPLTSLVRAYARSGDIDKARAFLEDVLEVSPDNPEAWVLLGGLARQTGDSAAAEKHYKQAIESGPDRAVGYLALGYHYQKAGDLDAATETMRNGHESVPDNTNLGLQLAGILEARDEREDAITVLEELYQERPYSDVVANNLASLLAEVRDDEESLDRAAKLAARLRKSPVPHFKDTVGWVHFKRGEYQPALEFLSEAAAALPDLALVRYHLGMAHKAAGNTEDAVAELEKALSLTEGRTFIHSDEVKAALAELRTSPETEEPAN